MALKFIERENTSSRIEFSISTVLIERSVGRDDFVEFLRRRRQQFSWLKKNNSSELEGATTWKSQSTFWPFGGQTLPFRENGSDGYT